MERERERGSERIKRGLRNDKFQERERETFFVNIHKKQIYASHHVSISYDRNHDDDKMDISHT